MSKLPVISGAECVKALGRVNFVVNRQRGSHIILVREDPSKFRYQLKLSNQVIGLDNLNDDYDVSLKWPPKTGQVSKL